MDRAGGDGLVDFFGVCGIVIEFFDDRFAFGVEFKDFGDLIDAKATGDAGFGVNFRFFGFGVGHGKKGLNSKFEIRISGHTG